MMTDSTLPTQQPTTAVKRWPYIIPLVAILALGGIFTKRLLDVERGLDPTLIPTVLLNTPLPTFDLPPLPGRGEALNSEELKGEVSLINVWGSWCVACVAEHPVLVEIAATGEVPIHGIAWRDDPTKSLTWLGRHGDPYSKVGQDPNSKAAIAFGVVAAPETFLIDKQGVIRYKQTGPISRSDWENKIRPLVARLKK
jgi:cytochrome c biogenesis protein CcmG, thiol:disulfide interchange protein DsbE